MRIAAFSILLISQVTIFGQASLHVSILDECNDSLTQIEFEVVDDQGNSYFLKDSIVRLKKPGHYFISGSYFRDGKLKLITSDVDIPDEHFTLIIRIPRIAEFSTDDSVLSPTKFYNCTQLCEGYCYDYYGNGQLRLEGKFHKGIPRGKLKYYNKDGSLNRTEKYSRHGIKKVKPSAQQ